MKKVIEDYINNKNEIVSDLLRRYEEININNDYDKQIKKLEKKIEEVRRKKEKLLELVINGYLEDDEFANRNNQLNEEITNYKQDIKLIEGQKNNMDKIKKNIENLSVKYQMN